jgi:hypothetical protein
MGEKALAYYRRGVASLESMGLDAVDKDYGWCLANMGVAHQDRGDWEQVMDWE